MLLATIEEAGKKLSPSKKERATKQLREVETNNVADSTPVSSKRSASSPVEVTGVKKHRTETAKEDWHIVKNNKKRDRAAKSPKSLKPWDVKQPKVKKKPDAVIINPN